MKSSKSLPQTQLGNLKHMDVSPNSMYVYGFFRITDKMFIITLGRDLKVFQI